MKKLLLALLLLASPAHAWDASKFDPGNPAASGFTIAFEDNFSSLSTIDINQTRADGYNWYYCIFDSSGCGAPPVGMFTIVTEGGETFLRIQSEWDTTEVLTSVRSPGTGNPVVGHTWSNGWFFEYETRFDPTRVQEPYPLSVPCFTPPTAQSGWIYVSPPLATATWSSANGGQATFTFPTDYPISATEGIQITDVTPAGYNGWYNVTTASSGSATVPMIADPGGAGSGGYINARGGWYGGTLYKGFSENAGCSCVPGSLTPGCSGWPGVWAQSVAWATLGYQKPGAQGGYAQYMENDIIEYAYHKWYGTDRMMLMSQIDWYGAWNATMPSGDVTNTSWANGTTSVTYSTSADIPPATIGGTVWISDLWINVGFIGYIVDDVLTVTEMDHGVIVPSDDWHGLIQGGSISWDPITTILKQLTGTPGGVGTYQVAPSQTVGSAEAPIFIQEPFVLPYDGTQTVTNVVGRTVSFAFDHNPGTFGNSGQLATAPSCPAGGSYLFCRRGINGASRIAYAPVGTNWNNWTKVQQLWVPGDATNGKRGFIETYVNGKPVTRADWVTDATQGGNPRIPNVGAVTDRMSYYLHLEAGAGYPIDINYLRVWQRP